MAAAVGLGDDSVWLVTGASTGLGAALAHELVTRGHRVVVTARDVGRLNGFPRSERILPAALDLTKPQTFQELLTTVETEFGPVDVLVNNAGFGLLGAVEETSEDERRLVMETNFFGPTELTRQLVAGLRARRRGAVVNLSSVSGVKGPPGSAYYAASKHALEGWSDSLRHELAPFGVHVMVVEPGAFRTDFFGRSRVQTEARFGIYGPVERRRDSPAEAYGAQPGVPELGARAILTALLSKAPPDRLVIGRTAVDTVRDTYLARAEEITRWEAVSRATDSR
ncbi:SDR family NAD(P)-dependent oxidoreductase [Streptomyces mexicanus]|jgi:short-subunit dehydrogenase|uniref:SDR family NAD(P)-dependent oxidoreductase n=1 Tax=Streptomyces mexicanus TaxID=178566 RepID=A0A7X1LR13_9ACTN|nr:SDR family NAD(P)-dependent oxidoreductase [Streptomyces mexicanus]MBC2864941.1 SDR family NAD(P)-dependent oxidoreductase [Streptomyces mexicanus]